MAQEIKILKKLNEKRNSGRLLRPHRRAPLLVVDDDTAVAGRRRRDGNNSFPSRPRG